MFAPQRTTGFLYFLSRVAVLFYYFIFVKIEAGFSGRMLRTVRSQASPRFSKAVANQYYIYSASRSAASIVDANYGFPHPRPIATSCVKTRFVTRLVAAIQPKVTACRNLAKHPHQRPNQQGAPGRRAAFFNHLMGQYTHQQQIDKLEEERFYFIPSFTKRPPHPRNLSA